MIESVEFAKYIISRVAAYNECAAQTIRLGETKLQKLLYICDGYLCACGVNAVRERARAWNYGPVYLKVHDWLARYTEKESSALEKTGESCSGVTLKKIERIGAEPLVDKVIAVFGHWTAGRLSLWTHEPGGPWEAALERGRGVMNSAVSKKDMAVYFKGMLDANRR
jgi:uncharacterized phage-associated protein